jgi:AbrB family looped-hinge helix DNA binding protein
VTNAVRRHRPLSRVDRQRDRWYNSVGLVLPKRSRHTVVTMSRTYYTSSVSQKGQITLPAELRRELEIEPKDIVVIALEDGKIQVEKAESHLLSGFGVVPVPDPSKSWKEIERDVFDDIAERNVRKWLFADTENQ